MGASEWGTPPNALRAKGVEKEEEEEEEERAFVMELILVFPTMALYLVKHKDNFHFSPGLVRA
jgi:hypothetical protein